jgi:hypothetical protein
VEYFRLELLYARTLRARRKVLGIDGGDDGPRLFSLLFLSSCQPACAPGI